MKIPPIALIPIVPPVYPVKKKHDKPEEPISFCSHLRRLALERQRQMTLQRLWNLMIGFIQPYEKPRRFNKIV